MGRWLAPTSQTQIEHVSVSRIDNREWSDAADVDNAYVALRRSVNHRGVIEPVLLRPLGNQRLQLVIGARRLQAARELGLATVPAVVRELAVTEAALLAVWATLPRLAPGDAASVATLLSSRGVPDGEVALLVAALAEPASMPPRVPTALFAASVGLRLASSESPVSLVFRALGNSRERALAAVVDVAPSPPPG